jgi:quinohemoprotein ethanol dehydrogenase
MARVTGAATATAPLRMIPAVLSAPVLGALFALSTGLAGCVDKKPAGPGAVTAERILAADADPGNWLTHGRTYSEQRFSPLDKITAANVNSLGLAWSVELGTNRGVEATPIVVDGVLYTSEPWSKVRAFNAKTGEQLWAYDPAVDKAVGQKACCDVVNRGVAVWNGKVFVGVLDGRLVALDAANGKEVWSVVTVDQSKPYTITGAPRVIKGKVIIGNGGAEYGVRGYVTAYDAETGAQAWRFYTTPNPNGKPDGAASDDVLARTAGATWSDGAWKTSGGGGTVWDSIVYDQELDQLLIGVGNGAPWNHEVRSGGKGDNLFLSSIVALNPDTGAYKWHYQTTPGDTWDYTATQQIMLATLTIDGKPRKVAMQAPKNGFFYVIDRTDGALISAEKYVTTTWASSIDRATGRPVEDPKARYTDGNPALIFPSSYGGHNWHPMSYSPQTGYVYLPAQEVGAAFQIDPDFKYRPGAWNTATSFRGAVLPADPAARRAIAATMTGMLVAWDPVAQKPAWTVMHKGPWNGGTLVTAGGLVFQGTADGRFVAYDAKTGAKAWESETYAATLAGPVTYMVDGEQYVAVNSGFGSVFFLVAGFAVPNDRRAPPQNGRLLVYKLGATGTVPPLEFAKLEIPQPPRQTADARTIAAGLGAYNANCAVCHGLGAEGAGVIPDLRMSASLGDPGYFKEVVIDGRLAAQGMVSFAQWVTPADAEAIRAYLISEAATAYRAQEAARAP